MTAKETILQKFIDGDFNFKSDKEIFKLLGVSSKEDVISINKILTELERSGEIIFINGALCKTEQSGIMRGVIAGNERGFGFFIPDDRTKPDLFIPHKFLNGAYHLDTVLVKRNLKGKSDDEGEVIKILKRGYTEIVGTFFQAKNHGYLVPDERKFHSDIFIAKTKTLNAQNGDKVIAKINKYPFNMAPDGEVKEILGEGGDLLTEELAIIRSHSLYEEFPERVIIEAKQKEQEQILANNREDFRDTLIITIDGEDSRDFDDAISIEINNKGNYVLGVHIADVSHYVQPKSALDNEAYKRGTSVYFPDRVLPMLPKELSNGICSLNEGEDRLTLSCVMEIDKKGNILDSRVVKSIINSNHRTTYNEITALLEGNSEMLKKYPDLVEMSKNMKELSLILTEKKADRGNIDLDVKEAKIMIGENGEITISQYDRTISHKIIEEFMILANETVAEFIFNMDLPFVYRIHESPSYEKAVAFKQYSASMGIITKFNPDNVFPKDYQTILNMADETVFSIINKVMLRSMQKARYSPENLGHFGLASKCYCHFTSPIRRYPDLIVHRIVKLVLEGRVGEVVDEYAQFVKDASIATSDAERKADEAERDVDELYKVMYMYDKIGKKFTGVISGVTSSGIYVELENTIEGKVKLEKLPVDDYEFIEQKYLLQGKENAFTIGEKVKVKVIDCDILSRNIEFLYLEKIK